MLSLTHLQANLFKLFKLAKNDGLQIQVHYHQIVYVITIERTLIPYKPRRWHRTMKQIKRGVSIDMKDCPDCSGVMVGGICTNPECPNSKNGLPIKQK